MGACPIIETERLVLRPFRESDLDSYTALLQAEPVRRALHLPQDIGREQAWAQLAMWLGQWELRGTGQWAVDEKSTGEFVGRVGLHWPERWDWPGVEVGWTIRPDRWGKGYATEAGARSVEYAFTEVGRGEVFSIILPENGRSQAVARRLGFSLAEERVLSHLPALPHGIWRLTAEEWQQRAAPRR